MSDVQVIKPNHKLKIKKQLQQNICYFSFEGDIDEDFVYQDLKAETQKYLIDFEKVDMINSCGIREWINFLAYLGEGSQIIYVNCPQIIIQQINMVEGFMTPSSHVHTFYAPYYCEDLDEERQFLLKAEEVMALKAPVKTLEQDGKVYEMEFDAIEKQYFNFISIQKDRQAS